MRRNSAYSTKIVENLVKIGGYIRSLQIWEYKFLVSDLNLLIMGLPMLETLVIHSMLLWELQNTRTRITSTSIRKLVVIEPDGSRGQYACLYGHNFGASAMWALPNLDSVVVHGCCGIRHVLKNMAGFLAEHQVNLRQIVFRRWVTPISNGEAALLRAQFSEFRNVSSSSTSVQCIKV